MRIRPNNESQCIKKVGATTQAESHSEKNCFLRNPSREQACDSLHTRLSETPSAPDSFLCDHQVTKIVSYVMLSHVYLRRRVEEEKRSSLLIYKLSGGLFE